MPEYTLRFYNTDPLGVFSSAAGFTGIWNGSNDAVGKITITDLQTGTDGETLDEVGENAIADAELNGTSGSGLTVFADESWSVWDPITDEIFMVTTLRIDDPPLEGWYTISEIPLVNGREYETLSFSGAPDSGLTDVLSYADVAVPDHIVTGTAGADNINSAYTGDAQNDQVDDGFAGGTGGNDNTIEGLGGNDTIDGGAGNDTIDGGADNDSLIGGTGADSILGGIGNDTLDGGSGNDTLNGEAGNDSILGGAGNDVISGGADADTIDGEGGNDTIDGGTGNDSITGGSGADTIDGGTGADTITGDDATVNRTEVLDWSAQGVDGTNVSAGFTQTTGDAEVSVSFSNDGNNNPTFTIETSDTQYLETGEGFDANSSLFLYGNGDAATSTTTIDFDPATGADIKDEVSDVSFRINDIDFYAGNHRDVITIIATNAAGQDVEVTFTSAGNDTELNNVITAGETLEAAADAAGSVLVEVAGPVSQIKIVYTNALTGTQGINVTDVFFDTIPIDAVSNDLISGGTGADVIDGMFGADTLIGGTGNDTLTGGLGDDVFVLEDDFDDDSITDFDIGDIDGDGVFNDQFDVSNLKDASGNPVNAWDVTVSNDGAGNAVLAFPNGETVTLEGVDPASISTAAQLNAAGIPCFTNGTMIRTPKGDVPIETLKVGDLVMTLDNGAKPLRWIGQRHLNAHALLANPEHKPICIPEGVCGNYAPLFVSPLHGMYLTEAQAGSESFARAKHLAEAPGPVRVANGKKKVTYIHLMLDAHQVVFANGAASESFYPGEFALEMYPAVEVKKILDVVPDLGVKSVEECYGPTARPFLKRKDVLKNVDVLALDTFLMAAE